MKRPSWRNGRGVRLFVLLMLSVEVCNGFVDTFLFKRPFWIDEWRVIYNLKTRNAAGLWQRLDFLQQFPRAYLSLVKLFTAAFDYSYSALRFPSFLAGCCAMLLAWRLMRRIYPEREWMQFLFPLIIVSSVPFTKYFVQTKQYTMDVLLSLLALWQVLKFLDLLTGEKLKADRYIALCGSMLLAPFFSYTYPIAIAPVFVLCLLAFRGRGARQRIGIALPLFLSLLGVVSVYWLDVRQLLADPGMKAFWRANFAPALGGAGILDNLFSCFSHAGSGFVFEMIFGVLGCIAFLRAVIKGLKAGLSDMLATEAWLRYYAAFLLCIVFVMFLAGKLPLGESRLNVFITPAVALLTIDLLRNQPAFTRAASVIGFILLLGVGGNILTTNIHDYTDSSLSRRCDIYSGIGAAINAAKVARLPILATPMLAYPYQKDPNLPDTLHTLPGDWILKTHPAYHFRDSIKVFPVATQEEAHAFLDTATTSAAVFVDGASFSILRRR